MGAQTAPSGRYRGRAVADLNPAPAFLIALDSSRTFRSADFAQYSISAQFSAEFANGKIKSPCPDVRDSTLTIIFRRWLRREVPNAQCSRPY